MGLSEADMYPNLEEAAWALALLAALHALRVRAWALGDAELRLVALETLAAAEMTGVGPVAGPSRARALGTTGVVMYILTWFLLRLYRDRYWKWKEKGNPSSNLASVQAQEQWLELACVCVWAQLTGGWIGNRYITWFSPLPVLYGAAVEAAGTFILEVTSRGLTTSPGCTHPQHQWAAFFAKFMIYVSVKLLAVNLTGSCYNPMAAAVQYHICFLDRNYVPRLVFVYLISPCLGASLAVRFAPFVENISHKVHEYFSDNVNASSEHSRNL